MSKIEDQDSSLYYVIRKGFFKRIVVAKIDPNTKCFYDYHVKEDVVNYADFQIGQSIRIDENKGFEIVDPNINEEVVKIIEQDNSFYKKLEEKYKDKPEFGFDNEPPNAVTILTDLMRQRLKNNKPVNLYIVAILKTLSSGMGLRVRWQHGGSLYSQMSPFDYPEELSEVLSAMYDIISEKLEKDESMNFILFENEGINQEYKNFIDEIERRTRYSSSCFGSDLADRIYDESHHGANFGFSKRRRELEIKKPRITISKKATMYYHDMASDNDIVETVTPEEAEEYLGWIIGVKKDNVSTNSHKKNLSGEEKTSIGKEKEKNERTANLESKKSNSSKISHCKIFKVWNNGISVSVDGKQGLTSIFYSGIDYSIFKPGQRVVILRNGNSVKIYDEKEYESNAKAHEKKPKSVPSNVSNDKDMLEFPELFELYKIKMAEGNVEAYTILKEMPYEDYSLLLHLDRHDIRGEKIYYLYKNCCNCNNELFRLTIIMIGENHFLQSEINDNLDPDNSFFIPFISDQEYAKYKANAFGGNSSENWNIFCEKCKYTFLNKLLVKKEITKHSMH